MTKITRNIKTLKFLASTLKPGVKPIAKQVIDLYESRKIDNIKTAEKMINQLNRKNSIKIAVENIKKYSKVKSIRKEYYTEIKHLEKKNDYLITGTIYYYILNYSYFLNSWVRSELRSTPISLKKEKIKKSTISREMIDREGLEIAILGEEYDNIEFLNPKKIVSNIKITPLSKAKLSSIALGHKKNSYKILEQADQININEGECVLDYILYELSGKHGFKSISRNKLLNYFNTSTPSTNQILDWAKTYNSISVYAIDPLNKVFAYHQAEDKQYSLCFVVNNNHLYPILDADTKKSIAQTKKIDLNRYQYNTIYDDIQYIDSEDTEIDMNKKVILFCDYKTKYGTDGKQIIQDDVILEKMHDVMIQKDENGKSYIITEIKFNQSKPVSFKNPITGQVYESTSEYYERKNIIDNLQIKYGEHIIKFQNQSYTQIAKTIFDNEFGNIKSITSNLSEKIFQVFDKHHLKPFIGTVDTNYFKDENSFGFDVCKSYSSVLINNEYKYPIIQQFDEIQIFTGELKSGEYYISKDIALCDGLMKYPRGWYPLNFTHFCLKQKVITKKDITMCIYAKQYIKADTFKLFVEHIYKTYDEATSKKIINYFIGDFGTKFNKEDIGCITSSWEIACSLLLQYQENNKINIDSVKDMHFVRVQTKQPKYNTGLPIHRHIIAGGIINLVNLYNEIKTNERPHKCIAFNTDSIMIKYDKSESKLLKGEDYGFCEDIFESELNKSSPLDNIGKIRDEPYKIKSYHIFEMEDRELEVFEPVSWNIEVEENFDDFVKQIDNLNSGLITGMPGCGKTEIINNIQKHDDLILSFTNCAVENARERCGIFKENFYTFDSFFTEHLTYSQKLDRISNYKRIIVDEYSMVPVKFMSLLNTIKRTQNKKLLFFGDNNQCLSIETTGIIYDYSKTSTFTNMCDSNMFVCSYKEKFSRYDLRLKNVLDTFIKDENAAIRLPISLKEKKQKNCYVNICRSLNKKWQIIQECTIRYNKEFQTNPMQLEFRPTINSKQINIALDVAVGMKFMCGTNMKELLLFNGTVVEIIKFTTDNQIKIINKNKLHSFSHEDFIKHFEPFFAQTIYRFQGLTIKEDFCIHELPIMSKRELYTSVSRGISLDKVHFNYTNNIFVNSDASNAVELKVKVDNDVDEQYLNSKIYKIEFDNYIYIGVTIRSLKERFQEHKKATKGSNFIKTLKENLDKAKITLIKLYPCNSLKQLQEEERLITEAYIDEGKLQVLNTINNRKKEIKPETEINIVRLDNINKEEKIYHIVENKVKNCLRYQATINNKKVDISVSLKSKTVELATQILKEKIDKLLGNQREPTDICQKSFRNKEFIINFN